MWELVKAIEEKARIHLSEHNEAKATLLVNFGDEGHCFPGVITEKDRLIQMIVKVISFLYDKACSTKEIERNNASVIKDMDEAKIKNPMCYFIGNCINKNTGYGQTGDCLSNNVQSVNCEYRCERDASENGKEEAK